MSELDPKKLSPGTAADDETGDQAACAETPQAADEHVTAETPAPADDPASAEDAPLSGTETGGNLKGRIEAILFVAGEPVDVNDLMRALDVSMLELESALDELRDEYDFGQRGFVLRRFGYQVQLTTRRLYSEDVVRLLQPVQRQTLSQAVMETLAIVAYRQPITKAEIEQIRGVKCDYSVQALSGKGLIAEVGRKDALGRPILYGTTDAFLQHFGIETLDDLPPLPEEGDADPAPELIP